MNTSILPVKIKAMLELLRAQSYRDDIILNVNVSRTHYVCEITVINEKFIDLAHDFKKSLQTEGWILCHKASIMNHALIMVFSKAIER